ncbi:hypothetical protein PTSG_02615 [Salpingoeca rosetta]|uniref:Vacuolar-sorting protein SNF8 n=1 Tax=Salpingoeca rosetta (strain ATCC 50818 / BSB-021) TaxID=946362 RepID=F2U2T5_SALR5|nr:uncharacterized protein PTSG_02615 [Salpingoeca rosetta]EGD81929.1 hypothetical protein PTSG_02615 [Salpingoeca rosetta]|eukprot:XP_004996112.1 hypothetical protein PTSG_02615 [Salpingoeca rosetta]
MPRKVKGVRGLKMREARKAEAQALGEKSKQEQAQEMHKQLGIFKENLEEFARKYKKEIKRSPDFRGDFQRMCHQIGVDPLASNKGFWSQLLGVGDFYYELGVQVVEACMATRGLNGGVIDIAELLNAVNTRRGSHVQRVATGDVEEAVARLQVLGSGFRVVKVDNRRVVVSQPKELNADHMAIFNRAKDCGYVTAEALCADLKWTNDRAQTALGELVQRGVAWVDEQAAPHEYWVPGLMAGSSQM